MWLFLKLHIIWCDESWKTHWVRFMGSSQRRSVFRPLPGGLNCELDIENRSPFRHVNWGMFKEPWVPEISMSQMIGKRKEHCLVVSSFNRSTSCINASKRSDSLWFAAAGEILQHRRAFLDCANIRIKSWSVIVPIKNCHELGANSPHNSQYQLCIYHGFLYASWILMAYFHRLMVSINIGL